jgi:hypothetical protein
MAQQFPSVAAKTSLSDWILGLFGVCALRHMCLREYPPFYLITLMVDIVSEVTEDKFDVV